MSENTPKNKLIWLVVGIIIGTIATLNFYDFLTPSSEKTNTADAEKKPLYWVAPMDANYKRDKPGKSPMGMDLVPVFDDEGTGPDEGPGTIQISANVVNNLGVRTATVSYKALHTEINTVGYVTYDEEKLVHIHPRIQGWIEKLHVKAVGEPVKKHQALYDIYSPELVNAQEELVLALSRNNSQLIKAAQNRLLALQLPKSAIDKLKETQQVQQKITFYAPQNGVVEALNIREGFFVKPGTTLLSIGDLSEVWVEAEVFERQAAQVTTGTPVTMTLDYLPGKSWQGKVDFIYPTLDAKTRTVKVRLRFANDKGEFKPNMFAQIAIHTSSNDHALLIPKEALIRTGNQDRVVLALGDGSFKSVAVNVGRFDNESVEIISGLSEGEEIVSSAQFLLDSESSKSSDFKRMLKQETETTEPTSVWVEAKIHNLIPDHKMLTLEHGAIPAWSWPAMTMDFIAANSIDFSGLYKGLSLHVEITKTADETYQIRAIHIPDESASSAMTKSMQNSGENIQSTKVSSATVNGRVNSLMKDHGMINISRAAIEKWNRPAATVDFITAEGVSLAMIEHGMEVKFTFEIKDGDFVIVDIAPLKEGEQVNSSSDEDTVVDHSNH